jgi:hypothetical protein
MALVGLATAAALALGGGARAARTEATAPPSLETLLRQRKDLIPAPLTRSSVDQVRARHGALEQRRADIEGNLPPAFRTPRSRRPRLRRPKQDLAGREGALEFDVDASNPDRLVSGVNR